MGFSTDQANNSTPFITFDTHTIGYSLTVIDVKSTIYLLYDRTVPNFNEHDRTNGNIAATFTSASGNGSMALKPDNSKLVLLIAYTPTPFKFA